MAKRMRQYDAPDETEYSGYAFEQANCVRRGGRFKTGDALDGVVLIKGSRHYHMDPIRKLTLHTINKPMRVLAMPSLPAHVLGGRRAWLLRASDGRYYLQVTDITPFDKCEWQENADWCSGRDVLSVVRELASPWAAKILTAASCHDSAAAEAYEQIRRKPRKR